SGIAAKILSEFKWLGLRETPAILSILVLEDLVMAAYLPLVAVLLSGGSGGNMAMTILLAISCVAVILLIALRWGHRLSAFFSHESDEIILLTTFGAVLLVAGLAQRLHVSAAIGAFLVGIALSGPIAKKAGRLVAPLRDLFAATFFFFFGLQIDPSTLPAMLLPALILGLATAVTKILTGYWAGRRTGVDKKGAWRAGVELI